MSEYFKDIIYKEEIDSTNTYLLDNLFADRTIVYSFNQNAGRGRLDRVWNNIAGKNLALSICFLKPQINPIWFTAAIALALIETLESYGIASAWIKWPNDVYTDNGKIAGILTEGQWTSGINMKSVTGIGININADRNDLSMIDKKTTSVFLETGRSIDIKKFTEKFIEYAAKYLRMADIKSIEQLKKYWIDHSKVVGKNAVLSDIYRGSEKIYGKVEYIDNDGYLYFNDGADVFKVVTGDINII